MRNGLCGALFVAGLLTVGTAIGAAEPHPAPPRSETVQEWLDRMQALYCDALMGGVGEGVYDKARGTCERTYRDVH